MRYTDVSDYWRALARYYEAADALVALPSSTERRPTNYGYHHGRIRGAERMRVPETRRTLSSVRWPERPKLRQDAAGAHGLPLLRRGHQTVAWLDLGKRGPAFLWSRMLHPTPLLRLPG